MMGIFDDILACYGDYHDYIQLSIVLLVFSAYFGLFIIISWRCACIFYSFMTSCAMYSALLILNDAELQISPESLSFSFNLIKVAWFH